MSNQTRPATQTDETTFQVSQRVGAARTTTTCDDPYHPMPIPQRVITWISIYRESPHIYIYILNTMYNTKTYYYDDVSCQNYLFDSVPTNLNTQPFKRGTGVITADKSSSPMVDRCWVRRPTSAGELAGRPSEVDGITSLWVGCSWNLQSPPL